MCVCALCTLCYNVKPCSRCKVFLSLRHYPVGWTQLWGYMYFCMRLRQMNDPNATGLRLSMRAMEAEVWGQIRDVSKPAFHWLAFDRAEGRPEGGATGEPTPGASNVSPGALR